MSRMILPAVVALTIGFSLTSCEIPKTTATGEEDEIVVFADSSTWEAVGSTVRSVFEDTVRTPIPETWFTIHWMPFDKFDEFKNHKNRIVLAPLDGIGPVSVYLHTVLDPKVRLLVEEGKEFVFAKYDTHARLQLSMYLTSPTLPTLETSIRHRHADLFFYFQKMALKRELSAIEAASSYHHKDVSSSLLDRYGWTITVQHDYWVAKDTAGENFFWMRRANPSDMERWVFVHWIDNADVSRFNDEFIIARRNDLTKKFMRTADDDAHVEIAPYNLEIQTVDFQRRFAYETRGNWRFSDKSGGGPFINYTFFDEKKKRIYMLDGSVFAPRVEKKKLILQVDGLLHTFSTREDPKSKSPE